MGRSPSVRATRDTSRSPRVREKRDHVRQELLACGGQLIAERGMAKVSVEEIIGAAGISRRTFYGYFANKFELAAGVIGPALSDGAAMLKATAEQAPDALLPGIIDCYESLWGSHSNALIAISSIDPAVMPFVKNEHDEFVAQIKAVLGKAERAGVLRNGDALCTFRVISKTAVPLLKIYANYPQGSKLYRDSMLALLGFGDAQG